MKAMDRLYSDEMPTAAQTRGASRQLALQDLARLVDSFDENSSEHLISILELLKVSEDSMEEIKQLMDV